MYNQPEMILEQYAVTVNEITKGRGSYICDTDQGLKALTPFCGSKERAAFLQELLLYLHGRGLAVEQILSTKEGEALATDESGEKFLLKDLVTGEECSTRRHEQMRTAAEALARLHVCFDECPLMIPEFMCAETAPLSDVYEKHGRELVKIKNYVKARKRKNEFEMKFQKEYAHFAAQAEESAGLLAACAGQRSVLCHGDFNQHSILRTGQGWQITHFEKVSCSGGISDLSNFLRKMMEKNDWDKELGMGILRAYDRVRPINADEYRQLYVLLLFPEKFWKLANHYYNTHKAWVSGRNIEKLDRMMAQEAKRVAFLQQLAERG